MAEGLSGKASPGSNPESSSLPPAAPPLVLTGRQRALLDALQQQHDALAEMYRGALLVLSQPNHPDRLALAAHGIRELAEKLPRYLDVPTEIQRARLQPAALRPMVTDLLAEWRKVCQVSSCATTDGWQGVIDKHLKGFLQRLEKFAIRFDQEIPNVLEQTARLMDVFDPLAKILPSRIRAMRAEEFKEYRDYFTAVAHHKDTSTEEFDKYLASFEQFIVERLRPATFDNFDEIDALLEEDGDDQARPD